MDANNITLQQAIDRCKDGYYGVSVEADKELGQIAEYLQQLAAYQDKTYIEPDFLTQNGFEPLKAGGYLLDAEVAEIEATLKDCEAGIWKVEVQYYESRTADTAYICTVGQMRLFLAAAGFEDILKA